MADSKQRFVCEADCYDFGLEEKHLALQQQQQILLRILRLTYINPPPALLAHIDFPSPLLDAGKELNFRWKSFRLCRMRGGWRMFNGILAAKINWIEWGRKSSQKRKNEKTSHANGNRRRTCFDCATRIPSTTSAIKFHWTFPIIVIITLSNLTEKKRNKREKKSSSLKTVLHQKWHLNSRSQRCGADEETSSN